VRFDHIARVIVYADHGITDWIDAELHRMYLEVCASNRGSDICAAVDLTLLLVAQSCAPQLTLMFFLHFAGAV